MLILAVLLTALITFSVFYAPVVTEIVKALRPKLVTVTITDATFKSVILVDREPDGKANEAIVVFSVDEPVDGYVKVTVFLKDAEGTTLDSGSAIFSDLIAGDHTAIVLLNNVAVIANVKSIEIMFTQVTG